MSCNIHSHIVDSRFFSRGYTTEEARRIFCDFRRLQRWLDVEAALAVSQAELGIIPRPAAEELQRCAGIERLDLEAIRADIIHTGHSLIPLLDAWQKTVNREAGRYIHFGATTQDIQDTAQALELKDITAIVNRDSRIIIQELIGLTRKYRDLVMIGRTHGQHALPTTLGLKIAVWLDEMLRNAERLLASGKSIAVSQLFGGVGTMAAFGDSGLELLAKFSRRLGLDPALCSWHTSRDRLVKLQADMAILAGGLAKIANEICQLARDEIGELEEPFHQGKIGSSTMPHKRNPEVCEQVVVLARLIKANAGLGFDSLISEHERDYRAIRLEWVTLVESSLFLCGALDLMKSILKDMIINQDKIQLNTRNSAGLISTEALMFLLGEKIGKQEAHKLIYVAAMAARSSGRPLVEMILENPAACDNFSRELLEETMAPAKHIGLAGQICDQVLASADKWLESAPPANDEVRQCPMADQNGVCKIP